MHFYVISTTSSANNDDDDNEHVFWTKASAAAEAVLDREAFLDKPFFLVHDQWTHQQMLSSSRVPPDSRPAVFEPM
jgi:hypothetical protein